MGGFIQQPGGGGSAGGGGAAAPAGPSAWMATPYWATDRAYAVGDMVRWGNGIYRAVKAQAAGASSSPGWSAPGLAAARLCPVLEVLKNPMTRVFHGGLPKSDINNGPTYFFKVIATAACTLTLANRADNPANRQLNAVVYGTTDGFAGGFSPSSFGRGASGTYPLSAGNTYHVAIYSDGYLAFDVSVDDPAKITGPDWEVITPGAPPVDRWRSADVAVTPGMAVVCDQTQHDAAGAYDGGTGIWTCPAGGFWQVETYLHMTGLTAGAVSYANIEPTQGSSYQALYYNTASKRLAQAAADAAGACVLQGINTIRAVRGQPWRVRIEPGAGTPILKGQGVHYQEPGADSARFKAKFVAPIW